ncbi:MAG: hypothetical protein QXU06_01705 [Candidatus Bathyarchaeia archaeon]
MSGAGPMEGAGGVVRINVFITNISGERLWDIDKPLPPQVQILVNINMLDMEQRESAIEVPFLLSVNFSPAIALMSIKGRAKVVGDAESLRRVIEDYSQRKPPPIQLIQAISNTAMAEAVLMSRSLGIPPPLPPLPQPSGDQRPSLNMKYTS